MAERTEDEQGREARIEKIVAELSLDEKIFMLSGHGFMDSVTGEGGRYCGEPHHIGAGNERLGVPKLFFLDGPRGVAAGESTCFPVPMARGASFDVDLEERIGQAIGREMRAHGANLFGGVCINLLRHPAWGRAQETYGEDPHLLGEMGAALVRGVQRHGVVATPKHFAANSMENARFTVDVKAEERPLREVYLPHFKRCIDEGAGAVMSAYNQLNGAYCGHNPELLTRILKEEWGFDGFVYSDFVLGCRGADACAAGLDVEAPDTIQFGEKLRLAVDDGVVPLARIDDAVRRILRSLFRALETPAPETYEPSVVACADHVALAREAAQKSIVLLKNENALPWDPAAVRRVLIVGRLAAEPNLGDHGSSRVYPPRVSTPLDGLRAACPPGCEIVHDAGDDRERVARLASEADAVLVVAGHTHLEEGEYIPAPMADPNDPTLTIGGDRLDLTLGKAQDQLVQAVAAANAKTVVAVMAGSAVLMEAWREQAAGILLLWYPGMEGGAALADVLWGAVDPSGRLPFTIPKRPEDLPYFDRDAAEIEYDLWHGYTKLERDGIEPAFPFGFGLSYSSFELAGAEALVEEETLRVGVDVRNAGARDAETVVQVYAGWAQPDADQPRKRLCGFGRVAVAGNGARRAEIEIPLKRLAWFDPEAKAWRLGARDWRLHVGTSSAEGLTVPLALEERTWSIRER